MAREIITVNSQSSKEAHRQVKQLVNEGKAASPELKAQLHDPEIEAYKQAQREGRQIVVVDLGAEPNPFSSDLNPAAHQARVEAMELLG